MGSVGIVDACLDGSTRGRLCSPAVGSGIAMLLVGDIELDAYRSWDRQNLWLWYNWGMIHEHRHSRRMS